MSIIRKSLIFQRYLNLLSFYIVKELKYAQKSNIRSQICTQSLKADQIMFQQPSTNKDNQVKETKQITETQKKSIDTNLKQKQNNNLTNINNNSQRNLQLELWDQRLKDCIYAIYLLKGKVESRIHLVIDHQVEGKINDQDLKQSKKAVEKLKRNKNLIFINFNPHIFNLDNMSEHLEQFGLSFKSKERQINFLTLNNSNSKKNKFKIRLLPIQKQQTISNKIDDQQSNNNIFDTEMTENLCMSILRKYEKVFAIDINRNYNQMKNISKQLQNEMKRYKQLLELVNFQKLNEQIDEQKRHNNLTAYALKRLHQSKQYLASSFLGTFSSFKSISTLNNNNSIKSYSKSLNLKRSLHWQIMQIMNELWQIEGDTLLKEVDKMPLKYIQQKYKMLDYQSIGGFMPSSCFQAIFSPPLRNTVNQIMQTLKALQLKILNQVQQVYQYFFDKTNIVDQLAEKQYEHIKRVCQIFRKQTEKTLNSQIEYISTSPEDFWSYRQLKSGIYGPQQQIYIQIKYIGKTYIRKVFQIIRQTVPRLIGQNLLKEVCQSLEINSLNILIEILRQTPLQIQMSFRELNELQYKKETFQKVDKLLVYFSLKTQSISAIKNYHERTQKNWKRMFKSQQIDQFQNQNPQKEQKGFLQWARNIFKSKPRQKNDRRSYSQQKIKQEKAADNQSKAQHQRKQHILTEKNWLLIINTEKHVQCHKIEQSAKQGFPQKLRPSIWFYLSKHQRTAKLKVNEILSRKDKLSNEQQTELDQIYKQIEKDVMRTPPPSLFRMGNMKQSLTFVLRAYSILDKDLRYTQGMNFIVGIILCVLIHHGQTQEYIDVSAKNSKYYYQDIQDKALKILVFLMNQKGLRKIMFIQRETITDLCIRLEQYIQETSPVMYEKIMNSGFTIQMIFSGALISGLTTSQISFGLQKRVVDILLTQGFSSLYKIIGQFTSASQSLCRNLQNETLYFYLKGKLYNQVHKQIGEEGLTKMFNNL